MKKKWFCLAFLLLIIFTQGCQKQEPVHEPETGNQGETEGKSAVSIGMSFDSFVIERWIRDRDVFVSTARELGAEVNVQNANGDVKEQISQIRYLIDKGVDVLVIIAADCSAFSDVMEEAANKKIRTISYDRLIMNRPTITP